MADRQGLADRFIAALGKLEAERDAEPLVSLFADDAQVGNVNTADAFSGPDGARKFWTEYRGTFGEMKSEFRSIIETSERAALEWVTTGTSVNGKPIDYDGVSILEIADGMITGFRAYFDPSALGRQIGG